MEQAEKLTEDEKKLGEAVEHVAATFDADVYLYSGDLDDDGYGKLTTTISKHKNRTNAVLILATNGGSANVAYQIAKLFQKTYQELILFAPRKCKSAGTLLALGANRLLLDMHSELGPLDVQLLKQNEIGARKSGLLAKSSFEALGEAAFQLYENLMMNITLRSQGLVTFKLASELSATMVSNLLSKVYAQMNPDVVGDENRDLNVALQYGMRLINCSNNATFETVHRLVSDYPAHDFIIDDDEARELFRNVEYPSEQLYTIVGFFKELAYGESPSPKVFSLTRVSKQEVKSNEAQSADEGGGAMSPSRGGYALDEDRPPNRRRNSRPRGKGGDRPAAAPATAAEKPAAESIRDNVDSPPDTEDGPPLRVVKNDL